MLPLSENVKVIKILKEFCTNGGYLLFNISSIFVLLAYFTPYIMFPDYAMNNGLSTEEAAMVITVSGISGKVNAETWGQLHYKLP